MKTEYPTRGHDAFTLIEMFCMIGVLIVLGVLFMPVSHGNKARPERINCVNNLKQIGLAYRMWVLDHNESFPMQVAVTNGGTLERVGAGLVFPHFLVLSNELSTPKILWCPADKKRSEATTFNASFNDSQLSYFVGVDATYTNPQALLAGDRNITNGTRLRDGFLELTTNRPSAWTHEMHNRQGNVGLADGSVMQFSNAKLQEAVRWSGLTTNRLAVP
jgi:prepilin-type processing-associated H-X9-DG protein